MSRESEHEGFRRRYGPWALIAGASEGIGQAYAEQLAERGLNLLLVARRMEKLEATADAIRAAHGVEVRTASVDLGAADVLAQLAPHTDDVEVGLLVYNAAYSPIDRFVKVGLEEKQAMLDVNCRGPVMLASVYGGRMVERGRGGIILMSSMGGFQGSTNIATYAATKAFDTVLAEGLWAEMKPRGVHVLGCIAGATLTPNFMGATPQEKWSGVFPIEPAQVAAEGIANLAKGPTHVTGRMNRVARLVLSHLPRKATVQFMARTSDDLYGGDE